MAQIHGKEHYAQVTLVENSKTSNRRLHRIEVYRHGRSPIVLRGKNLPYFVYMCTDKDEKGERFMQIWEKPKTSKDATSTFLLAFMFFVGVCAFAIVRVIVSHECY